MSRTHDEIWGEIVRTAWLVRSQQRTNYERAERSLTNAIVSGADTVPFKDMEGLAEIVSDAMILVGLIEEHERAYPTEAGAQLPPHSGQVRRPTE
jgi:hypothetical protein